MFLIFMYLFYYYMYMYIFFFTFLIYREHSSPSVKTLENGLLNAS